MMSLRLRLRRVRQAPAVVLSAPAPAWVLLALEAARRGFKNARRFRDWCRRRGVEVHKDGRLEMVYPDEVDAAGPRRHSAPVTLPAPAPANDLRALAEEHVARSTRGKR